MPAKPKRISIAVATPAADVTPVSNFETNNRRASPDEAPRQRTGRASSSRYDGQKVLQLPSGVGQPVPSANVRTRIGAVVDPMGNGLGRIQATINRNVDVLELELSHGRISEGAYQVGRLIQTAFELMGGGGGSNWAGGDRKSPKLVSDAMAVRALEAAQTIQATMARVERAVGPIDAKLIRMVLQDRQTFSQCAALQGKTGDRGDRYIANRFRDALENVSTAWTTRGAGQPVPDDAYTELARAVQARRTAALASSEAVV